MSAGSKINRKQEALIAALLTEPTHAAAAVKAGVSEATCQRWLKEPGFMAEYRHARRNVDEGAIGQIQRATAEAVEALSRNLTCGNPAVEVRAAVAVLDKAIDGVTLIDLASQLEELDRRLQANDADPKPYPFPSSWKASQEGTP